MPREREYELDITPDGDTRQQGFTKLDSEMDDVFTYLNQDLNAIPAAQQAAIDAVNDSLNDFSKTLKIEDVVSRGPVVDIRSFGAVGDDVTNDTTAIIDALATGKNVFIPEGTFLVTSDILINERQIIFGVGEKSIIHLDGCTFGADGEKQGKAVYYFKIKDLAIKRTGTAGPAVSMIGATVSGNAYHIFCFQFDNLHVLESSNDTGVGVEFRTAYIGLINNLIVQNSSIGISFDVGSGSTTGVNSLMFNGGEIHSCIKHIYAYKLQATSFNCVAFEGSASISDPTHRSMDGVHLDGGCVGVGFYQCYCEEMGYNYDFKITDKTNGTNQNRNITLEGMSFRAGNFYNHAIDATPGGDLSKNYSIILEYVSGIKVDGTVKGIGYNLGVIDNNYGSTPTNVIGTFGFIVDDVINPLRTSPLMPDTPVGIAQVNKETYCFYNNFRSAYNRNNSTTTNTAGVDTVLRTFTIYDGQMGTLGHPWRIFVAGDLTSDAGNKTFKISLDGSLVKSFTVSDVSVSWAIEIEIVPNASNAAQMLIRLISGVTVNSFIAATSISGNYDIDIIGSSAVAAIRAKSSYLKAER